MSERLSDFHQFRNALAGLRAALVAPDVLRYPDDIAVELPYEAGKRFELWLLVNTGPEFQRDDIQRHCLLHTEDDGATAKRWTTVDGVKISWPLKMVIVVEDGRMLPEPVAEPLGAAVRRLGLQGS